MQVKQVGERKREVPVGMVQVYPFRIEQGARQDHLPVHMLANLHRRMVDFQVGEHHPSLFDGIMKAEPRGTEISQRAMVAPKQEILSEEHRTVAARDIEIVERLQMAAQARDSGIGAHPQGMVAVFGQSGHEITAQALLGGVTTYNAVCFW